MGRSRRRWLILAVGTLAQAATCSFIYGIPMLVPQLRADEGLSLAGAGLVVSAPTAGVLLTLVAWGALADRRGERVVLATGTALAAGLLAVAAAAQGVVLLSALLVLAGAAGASVNAASGRVVMGWFAKDERGLAMGTRQTAQPLGVAVAALGLPPLGHRYGVHVALLFPAALCALVAVAVLVAVVDPPRPPRTAATAISPYRSAPGPALRRVHAASSMLVVPQFAVSAFTLAYLVGQRHWDATTAGRVIFVFQLAGAAGRIAAGVWSDRVGSRLTPMRQLAAGAAVLMALLAAGAALGAGWIVAVFGVAALVTVADNGLAYTSVAELAGTDWSGRALGLHNTLQNVAAVVTPPALGWVIGGGRYALAFGLVAVFPLLAIPLTPVRAERPSATGVPAEIERAKLSP